MSDMEKPIAWCCLQSSQNHFRWMKQSNQNKRKPETGQFLFVFIYLKFSALFAVRGIGLSAIIQELQENEDEAHFQSLVPLNNFTVQRASVSSI